MPGVYEFLHNPTAKDIKIGHKPEKFNPNLFRGSDDHTISLYSEKRAGIKANNISKYKYKNLKSESEDFVTTVVARELQNNPKLLLKCKKGIIQALPYIADSIKANQQIQINLRKAYINSLRANKKLPLLLSLATGGILSMSDTATKMLHASGVKSVSSSNKILLLTAKQQLSKEYIPADKYHGFYKGKLAITRFSPEIVNKLKSFHKYNGTKKLIAHLMESYNIKLETLKARENILDESSSFSVLTSEEIAEGLLNGLYTKDQVCKCCDKAKIAEINSFIKSRCI